MLKINSHKILLYGGMTVLAMFLSAFPVGNAIPHSPAEGDMVMKKNSFCIGENVQNGEPVYIENDDFRKHWLINGGTGRGKSKLLEGRIRYHLRNNHGIMLLDPHGTLYEDVLAYATRAGYKDRLVVINPNDTAHSVGLNFLTRNSMDASAHASQVINAISKVFRENNDEVKPRYERWARNLILALIEAELTLADMLDFLSISNPMYRQAALCNLSNDYVRREWESFEAVKKHSDKENLIEAPLNRAAKLILSDNIRRILGQQKSTVDIGEAIEKGKIVLVNLAPLKVSRESQQVLGILLVDQVVNSAFQRTTQQAKRKPFYVIVDEAAELTSDDLPYSLQALRKLGIYFSLCYQTLAQIREIPGYYENVMTNCDVKIAFKSNREDSERLVNELFAGKINGDFIKDELYRSLLIPKESVREVISTGSSESESHGESNSVGDSTGTSSGYGASSSRGDGHADHIIPTPGIFNTDSMTSFTDSSSFSYGSSSINMQSSGSFKGQNDSHCYSKSISESRSLVPFYEFIREEELASRTYYSIEEIKERYIAWVMIQPMRHAHIKINDNDPIPMLTTLVKDVRAREIDKRMVIARSNARYALPVKKVDRMIEERRMALLEQPKNRAEQIEEGIENERWQ